MINIISIETVETAKALLIPTELDITPISAGPSIPPSEEPTTMRPPAVPL